MCFLRFVDRDLEERPPRSHFARDLSPSLARCPSPNFGKDDRPCSGPQKHDLALQAGSCSLAVRLAEMPVPTTEPRCSHRTDTPPAYQRTCLTRSSTS